MSSDGAARLLVFQVGSEQFAVELSAVHEVIELPPLQAVPDAPHTLLGIAALRGAMIPVFELGTLLRTGVGTAGSALVFTRAGRTVALAVDDVYDALLVEERELRPAPGMDGSDGLLLGLVRRGPNLIAILDADALLAAVRTNTEGERV